MERKREKERRGMEPKYEATKWVFGLWLSGSVSMALIVVWLVALTAVEFPDPAHETEWTCRWSVRAIMAFALAGLTVLVSLGVSLVVDILHWL